MKTLLQIRTTIKRKSCSIKLAQGRNKALNVLQFIHKEAYKTAMWLLRKNESMSITLPVHRTVDKRFPAVSAFSRVFSSDKYQWRFLLKLALLNKTNACFSACFCHVSTRLCAYILFYETLLPFGNPVRAALASESILNYVMEVSILRVFSLVQPFVILSSVLYHGSSESNFICYVESQLVLYPSWTCLVSQLFPSLLLPTLRIPA